MKGWLKKLFPASRVDEAAETPLPPEVQPFLRTCWKPITEVRSAPPTASKFCGRALVPEGETWPACGNCSQPLSLFVQIRSDELPLEAAAFGEGILQLFYCTSSEPCAVDAEPWVPFGKTTMSRILPLSASATAQELEGPKDAFPERAIVGWQPLSDVPNSEELGKLGVELSDDVSERLSEQGLPRTGDKLLGWPAWVQGVEYPSCPTCGAGMNLIFQVDSEDNVPYMFGDVGCGHLFQCPQHPRVLGFGWACC